jgi:hypothetical protein
MSQEKTSIRKDVKRMIHYPIKNPLTSFSSGGIEAPIEISMGPGLSQTLFRLAHASWYNLPIVMKMARKKRPNMKVGDVPKYWSMRYPRYRKRKEAKTMTNPQALMTMIC